MLAAVDLFNPDWWYSLLPLKNRALLENTLFLIPLFPLVGFLLNGLFGSRMEKKVSGWIAVLAALSSFIWAFFSVMALHVPNPASESRNMLHMIYGTWLSNSDLNFTFGLMLDQISSVMILVVTGIGTLIHIYSLGYMAHDPGFSRFFAYLNLFLFAMILLVLGDNLIVLFVGWEGVGLCSYLLIGFWYEDGKNAAAGMKAFVVNRIGDLGFLLGIFLLFSLFGTVDFTARPVRPTPKSAHITSQTTMTASPKDANRKDFVSVPKRAGLLDYAEALRLLKDHKDAREDERRVGYRAPETASNLDLSKTTAKTAWAGWYIVDAVTLTCLLLFVGAMGKSAQIPLYVWLPDAMAGPTPVSALIHAATMVTAGVYMICRLHPLFAMSEQAMLAIAVVGGSTALFSALIGLTQLDIKKVLAYSTVSQLGYMFLGLGVGAFSLGIFHVLTHAFFKALLFLGAGSVIHAMSGEQDMRMMGGLRHKLPKTFITMLIGALALAGFPLLAGWWSKDAILMNVLARYDESHQTIFLALYAMGVIGAFCTAFYTFRLIGLTFYGETRASEDVKSHVHESPPSMTLPLIVLALLSLIGGWAWHGDFTTGAEGLGIRNFFFSEDHHAHMINLVVTTIAALGGIGLAWSRYFGGQHIPDPEKAKSNFLYRLSLNKFYVDEAYNALFVMPFIMGSEIVHALIEMLFIDLLVVGSGYAVSALSGLMRRIQTGLLNWYAGGILAGSLLILFYLLQ